LSDVAFEEAVCHQAGVYLRLRGAFGVKDMGCFPDLFQHVKEVQNQHDIQLLADQDLECALAVGQSDESRASIRVTMMDFGDHLVDYCSFTLDQTAPDALVLGLGRRRPVMVGLGMDAEQTFHDLLAGPNPWVKSRYAKRFTA
jgi:hypothetical protein